MAWYIPLPIALALMGLGFTCLRKDHYVPMAAQAFFAAAFLAVGLGAHLLAYTLDDWSRRAFLGAVGAILLIGASETYRWVRQHQMQTAGANELTLDADAARGRNMAAQAIAPADPGIESKSRVDRSIAARVRVEEFNFIPSEFEGLKRIQLTVKNIGPIRGTAPKYHVAAFATNRALNQGELGERWEPFASEAMSFGGPQMDQLEIEPGEVLLTPTMFGPTVTEFDLSEAAEGRKYIYVFAVLVYRDPNLEAGEYWVSHFCGYQGPAQNHITLCGYHNGTRLERE